ncbi:MAG: protein-L-isoaspartate O-methyltransferase [Candidatus Thermoplasmatota archaeon]|jgi:protein-L-isoaspartate(D-aspartate) O-methyltransferase|nr:protein-L-isoaspartate O-methyltransferase [Candidatus Thermoplasmatota archaeon]
MREILIKQLKKEGYIHTKAVEEAMRKVDRELFIPRADPEKAYEDSPQRIGHGQTISAPHMVAIMCEELKLDKGMNVLEIGGGGGYHAAVVGEIVGDGGSVLSAEIVEELAERAGANIKKTGLDDRVTIVAGDGVKVAIDRGKFDRIYLAAAAPDISEILIKCLNDGGILLMPVGAKYFSELTRYEKKGDDVKISHLGGCAFVPLTGEYGL